MAGPEYVSLEEIVAAPVAAIVEHWQESSADAAYDAAVVERQGITAGIGPVMANPGTCRAFAQRSRRREPECIGRAVRD